MSIKPLFRATMLFAACLLLTGPALAQAQLTNFPNRAAFEAFVQSADYRDYISSAFNMLEPAPFKAQCPNLKLVVPDAYVMLQAPRFTTIRGKRYVSSGKWIARPVFDRCGTRIIRRALLEAIGNRQIKPLYLLPGDFRGDLRMEADARRIVLPGIMAKAGCRDANRTYVFDIAARGRPTANGWSETWTTVSCGRTVISDVTYSGPRNGLTTITSREH